MKHFLAAAAFVLAAAAASADEIPDLVKRLKSGDVDARRTAAKALGEQGAAAKDAVTALAVALKDQDRFVRRFAAQALGEIGPDAKSTSTALSAMLRAGNDRKEVLDAVAEALGKIGGGPASLDALVATLRDGSRDATVRRQAAESLGRMGSQAKPAIPALVDVLKPTKRPPAAGSGDVRAEAASALGEIAGPDDKSAVEALTTLSNDRMLRRDRTLMKAVSDALKKIQAKGA
jgi:HEAT repeat protein